MGTLQTTRGKLLSPPSNGSTDVDVIRVVSGWQQRQFLDLPWQLYADQPAWIPRIRASERSLAGLAHHAFHDRATCAPFLALRAGQPCGRIVAIDNPVHGQLHPPHQLGFLGFFDCIDDADVAAALFAAAEEWLRSRSLTEVRGPVSPSMNYEAGLLVDGFDQPPTFMMPYNPHYYPALWEANGFNKVQDLFAFRADISMLNGMNQKVRNICELARERFGAEFRQVDRRRFQRDVEKFLELYNLASAGTWGFVPLSTSEIRQLAGELKHLIVPHLTAFMIVDRQIVGAAFAMLDYNPIVRRIRGRLFPTGLLSLRFGRAALKKIRVMSINVAPAYQKWGLGLSLLEFLAYRAVPAGIREVEFSYVLESNHLACSTLVNGGAILEKTYRVYQKPISGDVGARL